MYSVLRYAVLIIFLLRPQDLDLQKLGQVPPGHPRRGVASDLQKLGQVPPGHPRRGVASDTTGHLLRGVASVTPVGAKAVGVGKHHACTRLSL